MVYTRGWWFLVALNIFFLIAGQTAAVLLGRFYYDKGGNSKWMSTLVQTIGFPILIFALFIIPKTLPNDSTTLSPSSTEPSIVKLILVYTGIGLLVGCDNLMYSYGLLYLPVSTYSLVCATQLAFNAIFSYFLNAQKFTHLIFNSVVLSFSATLLGVHTDNESSSNISHGKYALGFILTLGASATYSLILLLMQVSFEKMASRVNNIFRNAPARPDSKVSKLGFLMVGGEPLEQTTREAATECVRSTYTTNAEADMLVANDDVLWWSVEELGGRGDKVVKGAGGRVDMLAGGVADAEAAEVGMELQDVDGGAVEAMGYGEAGEEGVRKHCSQLQLVVLGGWRVAAVEALREPSDGWHRPVAGCYWRRKIGSCMWS